MNTQKPKKAENGVSLSFSLVVKLRIEEMRKQRVSLKLCVVVSLECETPKSCCITWLVLQTLIKKREVDNGFGLIVI